MVDVNINRVSNHYYRTIIQIFKIALLVIMVFLALSIAIWPMINQQQEYFANTLQNFLTDTSIQMQIGEAEYSGFQSQEDLPFTLSAEHIMQKENSLSELILNAPKADLVLEDESWLAVSAKAGFFDQKNKILSLNNDVLIFHDKGYELQTQTAIIDIESRVIEGFEYLEASGSFGRMSGKGFILEKSGQRIIVKGPAKILFHPK